MSATKTPEKENFQNPELKIIESHRESSLQLSASDPGESQFRAKSNTSNDSGRKFNNTIIDEYTIGNKHLKEILTEQIQEEEKTSTFSWITSGALILSSFRTVYELYDLTSKHVQDAAGKATSGLSVSLGIATIVLCLYVVEKGKEFFKSLKNKRTSKADRIEIIMALCRMEIPKIKQNAKKKSWWTKNGNLFKR